MDWQRTNILAAANYLRELIARGAADARTKAVYEGLLEVLEPARRTARVQRELASSAKLAAAVAAREAAAREAAERRSGRERRAGPERRLRNAGPPLGLERRSGHDRRTGRDRRGRS